MTIGERIQNARKKSGLTQEELGERVGVTGVAIMRYEKGARQPRLEQLQRIAGALEVSVDYLLGRVNHPLAYVDIEKTAHAMGFEALGELSPEQRVTAAMEQLSPEGQVKVADYAEDILPRYQAQTPASAPPPAPEGRATPPQEGSEGPQESK